jgi:hypothetical protein
MFLRTFGERRVSDSLPTIACELLLGQSIARA